MGRQAVDGPFAEWTRKIAAAPLVATDSSVRYGAPGLGEVSFAWDGPLRVAGREIALHEYRRFDNPYTNVAWGQSRYEIQHGGLKLIIDFARDLHQETVRRERAG
jgi:hypothetical protein